MSSGYHSHLLQTVTNLVVEYQPVTLHVTLCVNFLSIHMTLQHACRFMHLLFCTMKKQRLSLPELVLP